MRYLITLSIFSLSLFAAERPIGLDAHLHYYPDDDGFVAKPPRPEPIYIALDDGLKFCTNCGKEIINQLPYKDITDKDNVKTSFLISPSFHVQENVTKSASIPEWRGNLKFVSILDKRVSALVQKSPGKYIGLCGFSGEWKHDFSLKAVSDCMALPGMKGLKIHSHMGLVDTAETQQVLKRVLDQNFNKKPGVILWHLKEESELDFLLSILKDYPNTKFIIAHSMKDSKAISKILELEKLQGRFNNLYLETSDTDPEKLKADWVAFGLDRVLYGSDNFIKSHDELITSGVFTTDELDQILNINATKILTYLGHPEVNNSDRSIPRQLKETKPGNSKKSGSKPL
jgi:predicted TIM-barrel fold metal-dependent hydrolase